MNGGQEPADQAQEFEVTPATPAAPRTGLMMAGALAVLVVAVVGAYFAASASNDDTEVDVAAPEAVAEEADEEAEVPAEDDAAADAIDEGEDADEAEAGDAEIAEEEMMTEAVDFASDTAIGFGGPQNVVHIGGEFISIGWGPEGQSVSRSADGTEWASTPLVGIPENSNMTGIVEVAGGFATVIEVWPEYDETDEPMYFGPPDTPERLLATSADLVNWETSELPAVEVEDGGFSHVSGIAASGDTIAVLVQVEPAYVDEMRILFEAGLLAEADLENFCGTRIDGPDDPVIVQSCDWEAQEEFYMEFEAKLEAAESDEERMALEEEYFGNAEEPGVTEMFRVEPGDPVHDQIFEGFNVEPQAVAPVVLSGPIGALTRSDLPVDGHASSIVGTDAGFITIVNDWQNGTTQAVTSTDGATWSVGGSIGSQLDVQGMAVAGDVVIAVGNRWNDVESTIGVWTTTDLGATWTATDLPTELFSAYGMPIGGPAGVAISVEGSTEPYPEGFGMPDVLEANSDGYTLEIIFESDLMVLTGADGVVVHEVPGIVFDPPADNIIDGVVRFDGEYGTDITFLDPATGEDLVTFGEDNFAAAYEGTEPFGPDVDHVEPPRRTEVWFSADGANWTLLESTDVDDENGETWTALAGVGDDEVLMRTETFVQPPMELWAFEEENREPTDEEIAALDAWHLDNGGSNVEWRRIPVG